MDHRHKIREFLARFFQADQLRGQDDIFAMGFVNSLFAMQLVMYIESEFGITIDDQDLEITNFNTVDNIDVFITRKRCAVGV
jgi:methoxymalonate biosynthesis acyl carrier protein